MNIKLCIKKYSSPVIFYLVLSLSLYWPFVTNAKPLQQNPEKRIKVAVLEFKNKTVTPEDAAVITDLFRTELFNADKVIILDKSAIEEVLKKFNYSAAGICDYECEINIGENLQCDRVISGDVSKLGDLYIINIRMVDVHTASIVFQQAFKQKCEIEQLAYLMPDIVSEFINKAGIASSDSIKVAEIQQPIKGKLKITVIPDGATVIANDKLLGISPFEEKELEAGAYKITARKAGYEPRETTVNISNGKTEEIKIELKPLEAQSGVITDKGGTAPEEEEGGGGTLWWILGGAAVVATAVVLASGGSNEVTPPPTVTGTLKVENQTSSTVSILIDNASQGTIAANVTQSYTLYVGTYTLKITSVDSSSLMQAASSLNFSSESKNSKSNLKYGTRRASSSKVTSLPSRRLSSFSQTYTIPISANQTYSVSHSDTNWAYGDLKINSTPTGAEIWLNGVKRTETTNIVLNDITSGSYGITLKLSGYSDFSTSVEVSNGRTTRVDYDFSVTPGKISITSNPSGAQIKLDGNETGKATPALLENVNPGSHKITLTLGGYDPVDRMVEVRSNETASINVNLSEQTGNIQVTSTPDGASVWLDSVDQGKTTPVTLYTGCVLMCFGNVIFYVFMVKFFKKQCRYLWIGSFYKFLFGILAFFL